MRVLPCLFLLVAFTLGGCGEKDEKKDDATMTPGEDCLPCHQDFSVGGTVYPSQRSAATEGIAGVTVTIVDSAQKTLTLTSNSAGNFYSKEPIAWPADVTFTLGTRTANMVAAPSGGCGSGSCHSPVRQGYPYLP